MNMIQPATRCTVICIAATPDEQPPDQYPTRPGEAFDPLWLQSPATLNRTRLADLPGAETEWVGRRAFDLLSLEALGQLPSGQAADVFGRRLGHLVATLHRGARSEPESSHWRQKYLEYWSTIEEVWLAGGLAARLCERMVDVARTEARRLGAGGVDIRLARYPSVLPLIGAARSNLSAREVASVFDFGHSQIKRGIAHYSGQTLVELELLAPLDAPLESQDALASVISALERTGARGAVIASIASYVGRDGRLVESHSRYASVTPDAIQSAIPWIQPRLGHDGTLAACGILPQSRPAAVIMLGTALGVGFAPPADSLRPPSARFRAATNG